MMLFQIVLCCRGAISHCAPTLSGRHIFTQPLSIHSNCSLGTAYGLNRYDGYNFKLFTREDNALQANANIAHIREDEEGRLWLHGGLRATAGPLRRRPNTLFYT